MASQRAIFLSASVPDPKREAKYFDTADPVAIGAAVSALVNVTLGRRLLVWGGHPSITPMIWTAAADLGVNYGAWVHLFQSRLYQDDYPEENAKFKNVTYVDPVEGKPGPSLAEMRQRMLEDFEYEAGIFIGGMEGVELEFALFKERHRDAKVFPFASTGGAALLLFKRTPDLPSYLKDSLDYVGDIHRMLNIAPSEPRRESPDALVRSGIQPSREEPRSHSIADGGLMPNNSRASQLSPADNPAVVAHVSLLQGIINRLANNSASCKTWCLTLVAALLGLAGATHVPGIVAFALVPVVIFGLLDTMYLAQERAYRGLYDSITNRIRSRSYALDDAYEARAPLRFSGFSSALTSWSVFPVYLGLIITYLVAYLAGWLSVLTLPGK
jgi:SLOG cluster3 family